LFDGVCDKRVDHVFILQAEVHILVLTIVLFQGVVQIFENILLLRFNFQLQVPLVSPVISLFIIMNEFDEVLHLSDFRSKLMICDVSNLILHLKQLGLLLSQHKRHTLCKSAHQWIFTFVNLSAPL
jgi:hypothetical protein